MARKLKTSPSAAAMDGAIELDLDAKASHYPERCAFIDADEPNAGREITRALDDGYAIVLVASDGKQHLLTEQLPAA